MEVNVSVKCAVCGEDIPINSRRYKLVNDYICNNCADIFTLADIYCAEKISNLFYFDGEMWYNPFLEPDNEGDNGREYDGELEPVD